MNGLTLSHVVRSSLLVVLVLALAGPSWSQVIEHKLTASDGAVGDWFGFSVSLSEGTRALVGAWMDDNFRGSAYVFERQGDGSWLEVDKLTASDGAVGDGFGGSVSLSGDRALVGASGDASSRGSAYVYERQSDGSWLEVDKITASGGAAGDQFGESVSLSGDHALVGAQFDNDLGTDSGSAYVFERQSDGSWLEVDKITASDGAAGDRLGDSVSLSGTRALVAAYLDDDLGSNSGSAYVYERQSDGSWLEIDKLTASDGAADDQFGISVSLSEGTRALVGAWMDDDLGSNSGSAYVYERQSDGSWLEIDKLTASDGAADDLFGRPVSLSGDRALVGAMFNDDLGSNSGSAYVFDNILPTAVEMPVDLPHGYLLSAPYPNPFNPRTVVPFEVPEAAHVRLTLVDVFGREITTLLDGHVAAGRHEAVLDGGRLASGVYLVRLEAEGVVHATQKVLLLR